MSVLDSDGKIEIATERNREKVEFHVRSDTDRQIQIQIDTDRQKDRQTESRTN